MGKTVYQENRELELTWDQEFRTQLVNQWNKWLTSSSYKITIPRSISLPDANKNHAYIRIVGDSSITGTCATVYAVAFLPKGAQQNIISNIKNHT